MNTETVTYKCIGFQTLNPIKVSGDSITKHSLPVWVDCFGANHLLPDTSEGLRPGLEQSPAESDLAYVQETCSRYAAPLEESRSVNID